MICRHFFFSVVNSLKVASSSLISLKEQERLAEEQCKTYKSKTENVLSENKAEYKERKTALENKHPIYMELKNARVQHEKVVIEEKMALQEVKNLKKILKLRKEIQRKFFTNSIVSFISAIKSYHDNKAVHLKLKMAEKNEAQLIGILEEKLKQQCNRNKYFTCTFFFFFFNFQVQRRRRIIQFSQLCFLNYLQILW